MTDTKVTRRNVIKGVIAAGAVSSAGYLFRTNTVFGQSSAPGSVERLITLDVNGQQRRVDVIPAGQEQRVDAIQAALSGAKFYGLHDRNNPADAGLNVHGADLGGMKRSHREDLVRHDGAPTGGLDQRVDVHDLRPRR